MQESALDMHFADIEIEYCVNRQENAKSKWSTGSRVFLQAMFLLIPISMWRNSGFTNLVAIIEFLDLVQYMAPYNVGIFRNLDHRNRITSLQKHAFVSFICVLRYMCWQSLRLTQQKFLRFESSVILLTIFFFTAGQSGSWQQLNIRCVDNIRSITKLHSLREGGLCEVRDVRDLIQCVMKAFLLCFLSVPGILLKRDLAFCVFLVFNSIIRAAIIVQIFIIVIFGIHADLKLINNF